MLHRAHHEAVKRPREEDNNQSSKHHDAAQRTHEEELSSSNRNASSYCLTWSLQLFNTTRYCAGQPPLTFRDLTMQNNTTLSKHW